MRGITLPFFLERIVSGILLHSASLASLIHKFRKGIYSYFEKGCRKNVHATIPKGNMGYEQYAVPDTVAVEPTFVAFL